MKVPLVIILAIVLTSCVKNSKVENQKSAVKENKQINDQRLSNGFLKDSVLIENKVMHAFSQIDGKDLFYICIKGKSILEGKIIFKITKGDGTEILNEEFPSNQFIGYGSEGDKEDFIKSRIKDFFNESNFIYPAIKSDKTFDEDYSDKEIWDEIKSDHSVIGFSYLIGEEDIRSIAFSKKKGKVVMYFNCC